MVNYELTRDIKDFYHRNLEENSIAAVSNYLKKKMINDKAINDFEVGLALNDNELSEYLVRLGYTKKEILDSKLVKENEGELVDVIRERLIIPITDETGRCVAITEVDYNSIDDSEVTHQFDDSEVVIFNYSRCKQAKYGKIYFGTKIESLQLYSFGIDTCFSTSDRLISDEEIELIKKITLRVSIEVKMNDPISRYTLFYNTCKLLDKNVRVFIRPTHFRK